MSVFFAARSASCAARSATSSSIGAFCASYCSLRSVTPCELALLLAGELVQEGQLVGQGLGRAAA